jgi:hypothetical protein
MGDQGGRVAVLFRGDAALRASVTVDNTRLAPVLAALVDEGLDPQPVVYSDAWSADVRDQLLGVDGVLVWVDPVAGEGDRRLLDGLLRQVAEAGVWVGSHPDVIAEMGTKEVLYSTRQLGWGSDTHLYSSAEEFRRQFPARLAADGIRVLKPSRGNAGIGVWKVILGDGRGGSPVPGPDTVVRVQHALIRDQTTEEVSLAEAMSRAEAAFAAYGGTGRIVDQDFCRRIDSGIIRAYLVLDRVVGYARQYPAGLSPHDQPADPPPSVETIMGLPSHKTMCPPDEPALARLRHLLEHEWVPGMQTILGIDTASLPALWDADFLFGPSTLDGEDTYLLCEINASSVMPLPPEALPALARVTRQALGVGGPPSRR